MTAPPPECRNPPPTEAENAKRDARALLGELQRLGDRLTNRQFDTHQSGAEVEMLTRTILDSGVPLPLAVRTLLERLRAIGLDLQRPW